MEMNAEMMLLAGMEKAKDIPSPEQSGEHQDAEGNVTIVPNLDEDVRHPINRRLLTQAASNVMQPETEVSNDNCLLRKPLDSPFCRHD
jgi:hypothetical protein